MITLERANLVVASRELGQDIQVLVGKKLRGDFAGLTTFPGGKVNWDGTSWENRKGAAQREFLEETGLHVAIDSLRLAGRIRLYGERFGLIDIFHTESVDKEPINGDEMSLGWRTIEPGFYDDMPDDTQEWLPLVFAGESFRMNAAWQAGRLCLLANGREDTPDDIARYFDLAGNSS